VITLVNQTPTATIWTYYLDFGSVVDPSKHKFDMLHGFELFFLFSSISQLWNFFKDEWLFLKVLGWMQDRFWTFFALACI